MCVIAGERDRLESAWGSGRAARAKGDAIELRLARVGEVGRVTRDDYVVHEGAGPRSCKGVLLHQRPGIRIVDIAFAGTAACGEDIVAALVKAQANRNPAGLPL